MQNQGKIFPSQKAKSAVDFRKVWQRISLHARVSGNHNPSKLLRPTVKQATEKVHHQYQTLPDQDGILNGFYSDVIITPCYF